MIAFIKGVVCDVEDGKIVLECNGMGYNIFVPGSVIKCINGTGDELKIFTYMAVREDAISLYGFISKEEMEIFKKIINVSGIGPKGALGILTALTIDELKYAIVSDDAKAISKAPGIGAKTASKLILELKDKISIDDYTDAFEKEVNQGMAGADNIREEAISALVALGYSSTESYKAVMKLPKADYKDSSEIIKLALKNIM